jgi:hypothetical protein
MPVARTLGYGWMYVKSYLSIQRLYTYIYKTRFLLLKNEWFERGGESVLQAFSWVPPQHSITR